MNKFDMMSKDALSKMEEIMNASRLSDLLHRKEEEESPLLSWRAMLPLAIATSIDALASGIALAAVDGNIYWAVPFIGVITFILSSFGVKLGSIAGSKYKSKAELAGGLILIAIGLKILIQHCVEGI